MLYMIEWSKVILITYADFAAEVEQAVSRIDFDHTIEELRNLSIQLENIGEDDPAEDINDIIVELQHIRDSLALLAAQFVSARYCT